MRHHPVSEKDQLEDEERNLLELGRPEPELRVVQSILYLRLGPAAEVLADEVRVEGAEEVEGPDRPVLHLRVARLVPPLLLPHLVGVVAGPGPRPLEGDQVVGVWPAQPAQLPHDHVLVLQQDLL